jgi:DNA-binding FadR family transcriptional regulator
MEKPSRSASVITQSDGPLDLRTVVFSPIAPDGLVEQTARRLMEAIGIGLLQVGDRLPPEAQLSEWLGISPMTLREALSLLRNAGYVETRRGRAGGTFVKQAARPFNKAEARERLAGVNIEYVQDLTDYRRAIGSEAAALAADRATEPDIANLESRLSEIENKAAEYVEFLRVNAEFHIGVATICGSKRLWEEQTAMEMEFSGIALGVANEARPSSRRLSAFARNHAKLLDAIREHKPDDARGIARAHVDKEAEALVVPALGAR